MANENVLNEMENENQNKKLVKHPVDSTNLDGNSSTPTSSKK